MNKLFLYSILGATLVITLLAVYFLSRPTPSQYNVPALTGCLKEKKAVMYGAYWCSHCQNQKRLFGDYATEIPYVECTKDVKRCEKEGIKGYPTWIFADGSRVSGEMTLEALAEKTACRLQEN